MNHFDKNGNIIKIEYTCSTKNIYQLNFDKDFRRNPVEGAESVEE